MKHENSILGGVIGAVSMSMVLALARTLGWAENTEILFGTMLGARPGFFAFCLGFALNTGVGAALGLAYGWLFEHAFRRGGALPGLIVAAPHAMLGGTFLWLLPKLHPMIPGWFAPPGFMLSSYGMPGVLSYVASVAVFGAVVGTLYGETIHRSVITRVAPAS